ncbi:hypothetical protein [Phenylobacterium sp.]|uniref:hypothetical protein n=1 Tax=Phenylobacterium sp. TaxID=1871053 RepID=UPI0027306625|nr:hypothetical protein [Phenylobacterium sp.]MDP1601079.1 hypothetical protein [Phenylobacterium sp.]MDP3593773.1 hypothetical protein [Phenylobacterium sp.]
MKRIEISPVDSGWMLRTEAMESVLFFKSEASAESAAIRLAQGLADAGEEAAVEIFLRDGSLGRRFTTPPMRLQNIVGA